MGLLFIKEINSVEIIFSLNSWTNRQLRDGSTMTYNREGFFKRGVNRGKCQKMAKTSGPKVLRSALKHQVGMQSRWSISQQLNVFSQSVLWIPFLAFAHVSAIHWSPQYDR